MVTSPIHFRKLWPPVNSIFPTPPIPVKLDSQDTPPPLQYSPTPSDLERASPFETTPIGTPRGFGGHRKAERERDLLFSWHRKEANSYIDSTLLEPEHEEDCAFPLFGESLSGCDMADRSSPINIATQSHQILPRQQTSNLTSALQSTTGNELRPSSALNGYNALGKSAGGGGRGGSMGPISYNGAQPISMSTSNRPRRESVAGSLVNGMSWGGVSVNSWIRDE